MRGAVSLAVLCFLIAASTLGRARIPPNQRKFTSPAIDSVIANITGRMKDKEMAKIFENWLCLNEGVGQWCQLSFCERIWPCK
jgi:hypothetical protein